MSIEASLKEPDQAAVALTESSGGNLVFTIPLKYDELEADQLGFSPFAPQRTQNTHDSHQSTPRPLATERKVEGKFYFHVKCQPPRYGIYTNENGRKLAALVVMDLEFQSRGGSRFKKADLSIEFEDAATITLNPHETDIDSSIQPYIVKFEPEAFSLPKYKPTAGETKLRLGVSVSDPSNTVSAGMGVERTVPFIVNQPCSIHGALESEPPSRAYWVFREDKQSTEGILSKFSVVMVVAYTPGRKFGALVEVKAHVWFNELFPVCGSKDDPLWFLPPAEEDCVEELQNVDLRELTRLKEIGGKWALQ